MTHTFSALSINNSHNMTHEIKNQKMWENCTRNINEPDYCNCSGYRISYSSQNDIEPRKERLFPNGRTYNILSGMRLTTTLIDKADPSTIRSGDEPQGHPSEIRSLTSLWSGRHWAKLQERKITKEGVLLKWRWTLNLTAEETITGTHEEYITNPVTAISL